MSIKITMDELRVELENLRKIQNPNGFSSEEFREALGVSRWVAQQHLKALVKAQKIKFAGRRADTRIDGQSSMTPVYTLKTPNETNRQNQSQVQKKARVPKAIVRRIHANKKTQLRVRS